MSENDISELVVHIIDSDKTINELQQENQQLKQVLDEIREYINNRCLEEDGLVCYGDNMSPIDLMNILDKVKE